jgi:hypothetical protein
MILRAGTYTSGMGCFAYYIQRDLLQSKNDSLIRAKKKGKKLSPAQLLVGAGKVLRGERSQKREFTGKDRGADDFSEFLRIGARWRPAAGNSKES